MICGVNQMNAQIPLIKWTHKYGGNGGEGANAITTDKNGDIIFTGTSFSTEFNFGPYIYNTPSNSGGDVFVVKSDSLGNVLWLKSYTGMGQDEWAQSIKCDSVGNIYIGGHFTSNKFIVGTDTLINMQPGKENVFLLKLNPNGEPIWARSWGGSKSDQLKQMTLDKLGNIYITGPFKSDSIGFGNIIVEKYDTTVNNANDHDFYIAKISTLGNPIWAHSYGGNYITECNGIAVDQNNNAIITGDFKGDSLRFGDTVFNLINIRDAFMVKFNQMGNIISAKHINSSYSLTFSAITTDISDRIYIMGEVQGNISIGGTSLKNKNFIAAFNNNGDELWARGFGGIAIYEEIISIDSHNDIIISFRGYSSIADSLSLPDSLDLFLIKYSNIGDKVWATNYGNAWNFCYGMALNDNSIYLAGKFGGDMVFGDSILQGGLADIFIAKFSGGGSSGIYENSTNSTLSIYPNPSNGQFIIKNTLNTIEIYDFKGTLLYRETGVCQTEKQIDLSGLSKGLYFVKTYDQSGLKQSVQKIIIN